MTIGSQSIAASAASVTRFLRLKQRHFLTRQNRLRLRYSVSALGGMAVVVALYVGGQINPLPKDMEKNSTAIFANALEPNIGKTAPEPLLAFLLKSSSIATGRILEDAGLDAHRDQTGQIRRDRDVIESAEMAEKDTNTNSPAAEERHIEIGKGDTLAGALIKAGLGGNESQSVVSAIGKHFDLRGLQVGQELTLTVEPGDADSGYIFSALSFTPDPLRRVDVIRDGSDRIVATVDKKKVVKTHEAREVSIQGSVYGSADKANLPDRITASTIKLFSYAIDFQRDIHSGDKLNVMYDSYKTDEGYVAKTGDIVFAKMTVAGREYALYRHQARDGQVDYYTADGKSIRKSSGLMRTPVAYGRMSSGFGKRVHPVLGYTKVHKGVDFSAPTGTAIYASGSGVIERAGRFSTFGNYIRVRHSSKMS
ncbi:MAG: peptidoglycan DD-metalloendopeptidase family protein, partial [Pseudomonadota bacterium]